MPERVALKADLTYCLAFYDRQSGQILGWFATLAYAGVGCAMKVVLYYTAVLLVPLIPAVILYLLFETDNFAAYQDEIPGIELGGPIAAYFILMIAGDRIFRGLFDIQEQDPELEEIISNYRDYENVATELQGEWEFTTAFRQSPEAEQEETRGNTRVQKSRYRLRMDGDWLDENGNLQGQWWAKQVFLDEQELVYLFNVPDRDNPGSQLNGLGRVAIQRDSNGHVAKLQGTWNVLGRPARGDITFTPKT